MAIVGDAYVVVRAITSSVEADIQKAFNGVDKVGEKAGKDISDGVNRGVRKSGVDFNIFTPKFLKQATDAKERFSSLTRQAYVLAPALTAVSGVIGLLGTGLISLTSIIGAAATPALITLAGAFTAVGQAALTLKLAFSGVAKAVQAGNKASKKSVSNTRAQEDAEENLAKAYERLAKAREKAIEQIQQLGFDSEDAAISEKRAALELEKARETLARVSDLPPNSRARKEAELAFAEADLNYRRAIDKNNDLKKEEAKNVELSKDGAEAVVLGQENVIDALLDVKKAKEALNLAKEGSGADAYADALSGLSEEAKGFVEYLVSIQGEFKKLKDAAGESLFPQLETAIRILVKDLFPALAPLLKSTGDVLGKVAIEIAKVVTSTENIRRLESIWKTNNKFISNLGTAVGNLYEGFLILLNAAKPLIDAFGEFLKNVTGSWKETLKLDEATGKLAERFKIAQGILEDLGTILGNVFGGFKNLVKENVGPGSAGEIFLEYFKKISLEFKNLEKIDGKPLKEFFADAAENGTKLLSLLGTIIGGFIKLADNPELGVFLGQLEVVSKNFQKIGEDISASLPAFGEFLITFSEFIGLVTESGSITLFFNTLTSVLKTLNSILESPVGQFFLKLSAAILPVLLALGTVSKVGAFAFKVLVGGLLPLVTAFGALTGNVALANLTTATLGKTILTTLGGAIRSLFALLIASPIGPFIVIGAALVAIFVLLYKNSETFRNAVNSLGTSIKNGLGAAVEFISTKFTSLISYITTLPSKIASASRNLWEGFKNSFRDALNWIINKWNNFRIEARVPENSFTKLLGVAGKGFTLDTPNIPLLAAGGVVMPSAGGTLATIGEAGRPERIEPLDPDGLSKRDKAIIETLSGGKGSGINITINPSAGMDERELASIVSRQIAFQLRKGAA
jgi:phage-related protein